MINTRTTQKGSTHAILIVAAIIVLVGTLGFVLWSNFMRTKTSTTTNQATTSNTLNTSTETDMNTLKIAAWKIEFTTPTSLQDTSVKYQESSSTDTPSVVSYALTTARIQALGGKCAEAPFGNTVILNRYAEQQTAYPDSYWVSPDKIGGYYYVLSGPSASCSIFDKSGNMTQQVSTIEIADKNALIELVKSLKSSK